MRIALSAAIALIAILASSGTPVWAESSHPTSRDACVPDDKRDCPSEVNSQRPMPESGAPRLGHGDRLPVFGSPASLESPRTSAQRLDRLIQAGLPFCEENEDCETFVQMAIARDRLQRSHTADRGICETAILDLVKKRTARPPAWAGYDRACLGGLREFPDPSGDVDTRAFSLGKAGSLGALASAVGIVIVDGQVNCSGFLSDGGLFHTAYHCVRAVERAGNTVRQLSSGQLMSVNLRNAGKARYSNSIAGEWATYEILSDDHAPVPHIPAGEAAAGSSLGILAGNPHRLLGEDSPISLTTLGRMSFQDTCEYVHQSEWCVQAYCQTIQGFSGAPVFQTNRSTGGVELIGLLYGSYENAARKTCGALPIDRTRIIVRASRFIKQGES